MADYTLHAGDSKTLTIAIRDGEGSSVDVSDATSIIYAIFRKSTGEAVVTKTQDDGLTVAAHLITVTLSPADTAALPAGAYVHELEITTVDATVHTALQGEIDVLRGYIE